MFPVSPLQFKVIMDKLFLRNSSTVFFTIKNSANDAIWTLTHPAVQFCSGFYKNSALNLSFLCWSSGVDMSLLLAHLAQCSRGYLPQQIGPDRRELCKDEPHRIGSTTWLKRIGIKGVLPSRANCAAIVAICRSSLFPLGFPIRLRDQSY